MRDNARVADSTTEFFDGLGQRGHEPLLRKSKGTVRFEIADGKRIERRYVTVDRGNISVSGKGAGAQGIIRADRALFDRIATGELNPIAAVLRGELAIEGDWRLLVLVQRLFPGPPSKRATRRVAGYAKRRS
jgi:putative sterol carrier protein